MHLLLKISDSISRLESLLLISAPSQNGDAVDGAPPRTLPPSQSGLDGDTGSERLALLSVTLSRSSFSDSKRQIYRSRGNRAKHLLRITAEYNQLIYHSTKAQAEKCAFVSEMQWVCELDSTSLLPED